jgi:hypothetical protein
MWRLGVMTIRRWFAVVTGFLLTLACLVVADPAGADSGGNLGDGSRVCTDHTRSGNGVYLYGFAYNPAILGESGTWTVLRSTTVGGPETEVFRVTTDELTTSYVGRGQPGTFLYRACVTVHGSGVGVRLAVGAMPPLVDVTYDIGRHTATLSPGSKYCGDIVLGDTARIVGSANVPVQWSFSGRNEDYATVTRAWTGPVSATIDQVATGNWKPVVEVSACVANVSSTPATVSFELSPV